MPILVASPPVRHTLRNIFACTGLVLATVLSACSSVDDGADAADGQPTAGPAPTPTEVATPGGEGEAEPEPSDKATAGDEPETNDGSTTIGGAETGLTLEIPEEWVELPMDAGTVSEAAVGNLDLTDGQAAFIEAWTGMFPSSDGAVMAVDLSTMTERFAANMNARCAPNDGRIGRQPGVTPTPLQESDLEEMVELAIWDQFGRFAEDIEVESTTVDGYPAARGSYPLNMAEVAGVGVEYMFLADDDVCWATFTGADESELDLFDDIAATIDVL